MKQAADNKINLPLVVDDNVDLDLTTITTVFTRSLTHSCIVLLTQPYTVLLTHSHTLNRYGMIGIVKIKVLLYL